MGDIVIQSQVFNVGTSSSKIANANAARSFLAIQNKHASQTVKVKFGSAVVTSDVTQVQTLSFSGVPNAGSLVLSYNGNSAAAIASSDNASQVQTKLRAVTGLSSVTVAGSFGAGFVITMTSATPNLLATDPPLMVVVSNSLNIAAVIEAQTVSFSSSPTGGSFKLQYGLVQTTSIASTANATTVQNALRAIPDLSSVTVTGSFSAGFVVTMVGVSSPSLLTSTSNTLVHTATPVTISIAESAAASPQINVTASIVITTQGAFTDGFVLAAGASLVFGDSNDCPIDEVYVAASGANTRVELLTG